MELGSAGLQVLALIVEMPDIGDTSIATRQVTWEAGPGPAITRVKILIDSGDDIDLDVVEAV
jgi:hypothetical protein